MITLKFTGTHEEIINDIKNMLATLEGVKEETGKSGGYVEVIERPAPSPAVEPAEAPVAEAKEEPTPKPEPATAPATAAQATPTAAECKAKLIELRNKAGSKAVRELLKAHGAMTVPELKPEDYAAIMAEAEEALKNAN